MERQKSKHEKREKKKPRIKHPKQQQQQQRNELIQIMYKNLIRNGNQKSVGFFFKLRGKTNLIFVGVGLK